MAQRNIQFVEGEFYHIYNRGNSKQEIFLNDYDRDRFVKLLYVSNSRKSLNFRDDIQLKNIDVWDYDRGDPIVSIGAWVLMPNHFHLFVTIPYSKKPTPGVGGVENKDEESEISLFMRKLCGSYTKYFNNKHGRTGGLFESKFKATLTNTDEYTKYNFSYIHLNPIKLIDSSWKENGIKDLFKAKDFLNTYQWSSYLDFLNDNRKYSVILSKKDFPDYFTDPNIFQNEIFDWLNFYKEEII